jgi:PhoPQ-activated pathogenicity-related protein
MRKAIFNFLVLSVIIAVLAACSIKSQPLTPENALRSYLGNDDRSFKWETQDSTTAEGVKIYRLMMTSQTWRDTTWNHEMTVIVPDSVKYNDALLFITGGSIKNGVPNIHQWDKDEIVSFGQIAKVNKAIVSILWQVPNQPRYGGLTEDALISYTLHNYQNDHDFTWPLLFPMTKSAVRAMDAVQEFAARKNKPVDEFVVSGASKRGWTTWLTGASDNRVKAIGPMVIDMLNMPLSLDYHKVTWGDYSIQIEDYVKLGIAQQVGTPGGSDLVKMIDPYSYRKTLTMPKMIFMGTNDEYWPVDAVKNYIDSIPGDNHICYTPNAGHGLGDKKTALGTLSAFFASVISGQPVPKCNYSVSSETGKIAVTLNADKELLTDAVVWSASSPNREFRDKTWTSVSLGKTGVDSFIYETSAPDSGYQAFYIDLKYKAPFGGEFTQSTRMFLTDSTGILPAGK